MGNFIVTLTAKESIYEDLWFTRNFRFTSDAEARNFIDACLKKTTERIAYNGKLIRA